MRRTKSWYLLLFGLAVFAALFDFVPWVVRHAQYFVLDSVINRKEAFLQADVLVTAGVMLYFSFREGTPSELSRWLPLMALFLLGVAPALPLLFYLREQGKQLGSGLPSSREAFLSR